MKKQRRLKRDVLWDAILDSGIFDSPSLFHDGTYWCVSFDDPSNTFIGVSFITIGKNIKTSLAWVERNKHVRYP